MGAPAAAHVDRLTAPSATVRAVTVLQTIGVYVLVPLVLYGVVSLFTLWPKIARGPRYRPGQEWSFEPMWWIGNPDGVGHHGTGELGAGQLGAGHAAGAGTAVSTARGGARGNW